MTHYAVTIGPQGAGAECGRWVAIGETTRNLENVTCRSCLVQLGRIGEGIPMRAIVLTIALLFAPLGAWAACPAQAPTVDASSGSARICVPATADAPIDRVDVTFTAGGTSRALNFGPPSGQPTFASDFTFSVSIPAELRGPGSASLTSTGPGGDSEVASVAVIFRGYDRPAAPVLLAD